MYYFYCDSLQTLYYNFTDIKEREQVKRKKHTKQKRIIEEHQSEEVAVKEQINLKTMHPKEKQEHYDEDETGILESDEIPYVSTIATDISENKVEIVPSSEVTHILSDKTVPDIKANLKLDTNYSLIADVQEIHEKETQLQIKDNVKLSIKPSLNEIEPLVVTEIETNASVDDYETNKGIIGNIANKSVVPSESLVTTETLASMTTSDIKSEEKLPETAKTTVLLKDAINITEEMVSLKETPLHESPTKKSNATVAFSPLVGLNVLEITEQIKESNVETMNIEKAATSKLNFNLLESLQVGEVFVEDKSGKYYPELIVPTEMARKDVLVSNQVVTEVHDVQEREGLLSALKLPPAQEANIDIASKDSLVVSVEELHEKEGEFPVKEMPALVSVNKDIMLHSSLHNTVTTSHIKESEFVPDAMSLKKATIGVNELQHKFNLETNVHDSETLLEETRPNLGSHADIGITTLDKNIVNEVNVHESEKDLILKDEKVTAKADLDFKAFEPLITSETLEMTFTDDIKTYENPTKDSATETLITSSAKIVSYPLIHDKESTEEYTSKKPEAVVPSLVPSIPITVSEIESSECENKLTLNKIPDTVNAQAASSQPLKTPISQEINTADQINFLAQQPDLTEMASESRELQKEITVLQTNVEDQILQLQENKVTESEAKAVYIEKESLNVTEVITSLSEQGLEKGESKPNIFAKLEIDSDRKIAVVSEVTSRDTVSDLAPMVPNQEEAHVSSSHLISVQISQNEPLDSQSVMQSDKTPDFKSLKPEIIPSEEILNITETVHHEKESDYDKDSKPQSFKASTDIVGRPVAVLSEVTVDSSVGFTDVAAKEALKTANVQNITYNELIVNTTDYNEKEDELDATLKVNTFLASLNIDSNQAILIEENRTEIVPEVLEEKNNVLHATAKQEATITEAISQQEVMVHLSEEQLIKKDSDKLTKPIISLTTLQAPLYDEKIAIEQENTLSTSKTPDNQLAELSIICQQSLQTSEVVSHSDNVEDKNSLVMDYKKALPKVDDVYTKTAFTEEVITGEVLEEFNNEKIELQNSNITPIFKNTVEQMEIVLGESETMINEQPLTTTSIRGDFTETEALITSYMETIDKEKALDAETPQPKRDALIGFIPHSSSINTEVIASSTVENIEDTSFKTSKALLTQDDLQKHLERTEILIAEKETTFTKAKTDKHKATENIIEATAKEITEILTIEKENQFNQSSEPFSTSAQLSVNEKQSILSTEVIVNQDTEDFITPKTTKTSAAATHGLQEAIEKSQPYVCESEDIYENVMPTIRKPTGIIDEQKSIDITETIVNEAEMKLDAKTPTKGETVALSIQSGNYVNVTQITSSDKEEVFQPNELPDTKSVTAMLDVPMQTSIGVNEITVNEKEESLESHGETKYSHVGISVEPTDCLNVSENILVEKEDILKQTQVPKAVTNNVSLTTHKHVNVEVLQVSEVEQNIDLFDSKKEEIGNISVESVKPLFVQETKYEERTTEINTVENLKEQIPSVKLEEGQHLTITEVEITEKEQLIDSKEKTSVKQVEESFVPNLPIQIQEITVKESEAILPNETTPQKEVSGISIEPKQHITVISTIGEEKEHDMKVENIPIVGKHQVDIKSIDHITTTETVPIEEYEILKDETTKDEKALAKQAPFSELINLQLQPMETLKNMDVNFKPTEGEIRYELELHKSYTTTENLIHEVSDEISSRDDTYKKADKTINEMKSVQNLEIITGEKPESFETPGEHKTEKAAESHVPLQEISKMQPDIIEKVGDLPSFTKPETNTASFEVETHKSCVVSENVTQETPSNLVVTSESIKEITEQLLEMKPVEQIEVIAGENISSLKPEDQKETNILGKHIEMIPINQSSVVVHEREVNTNFEQLLPLEKASISLSTKESISVDEVIQEDSPNTFKSDQIKPVKAEKSVTLLTHVQCTENVAETQVKELVTPKTQTETTKITPTTVTPLIITDSESFQHETELHIPVTKKQKISKSFTVANEIEVSTEFIDEQALPYTEKKPLLLESKTTTTEEDRHDILITEQDSQIQGKF